VRHVRILATDEQGDFVQIAPDEHAERAFTHPERAPQWFADLVGPSIGTREVRVVLGPSRIGTILIVGEPRDELGEVWEEVSRRAVIWLGITALMLGLLYVVLGRLLNPLVGLAGGMQELEDGNFATRLAPPRVRELAVIASRFNTLAEALGKARAENSRLYRSVIELQEDERRQIANELHDEAGPCLFGITANVSSIRRLAELVPAAQATLIEQRADEVHTITERLKTINRDLLRRLRPIELGRIPLEELIGSLVAGFGRRHPEVTFSVAIGSLADKYGEAVDLTVFRCVQEALTNAMKHGGATSVGVELREERGVANGSDRLSRLHLTIQDNGAGLTAGAPPGIGMTAMRERVGGLGGSASIAASPGGGTTVSVQIPVPVKPLRNEHVQAQAIEGRI
jgi:two-component system sensor histidine kinase UhpB